MQPADTPVAQGRAPPGAPAEPAPSPVARDDLRCPLCGYDVRGLTEPRCPECGYRFVWSDLTDASKRLHPYLFEHHPQRRAWSLVRTHVGALRPKRFWTSLLPAQPSFRRRLLLYWLVAASAMVPFVAAHYTLWARSYAAWTEFERARWLKLYPADSPIGVDLSRQFGGMQQFLDRNFSLPPSPDFYTRAFDVERGWTLYFVFVALAWPWLTFLVLLVFRVSMRRARIKPVHVLRCVLYSFDAYAWLALLAAWVVIYRAVLTWSDVPPPQSLTHRLVPTPPIPDEMPYNYRPDMVPDALFWLTCAMLALCAYRLASAYRHYLRFDHPAATVVASQVIVALAAVVVAVHTFLM